MKESALDVLFYLFEHYAEIENPSITNRDVLQDDLRDAGFLPHEIGKAFEWLESLADMEENHPEAQQASSLRIFSEKEKIWLNAKAQGYLFFLEHSGILTPHTREQVIDKVVALEDVNFDLDKLKWVILMVLLNTPDEDDNFLWMDNITQHGTEPVYH